MFGKTILWHRALLFVLLLVVKRSTQIEILQKDGGSTQTRLQSGHFYRKSDLKNSVLSCQQSADEDGKLELWFNNRLISQNEFAISADDDSSQLGVLECKNVVEQREEFQVVSFAFLQIIRDDQNLAVLTSVKDSANLEVETVDDTNGKHCQMLQTKRQKFNKISNFLCFQSCNIWQPNLIQMLSKALILNSNAEWTPNLGTANLSGSSTAKNKHKTCQNM